MVVADKDGHPEQPEHAKHQGKQERGGIEHRDQPAADVAAALFALAALAGVEAVGGVKHKDNLYHTLEVVDNLALAQAEAGRTGVRAEGYDLWLRWAGGPGGAEAGTLAVFVGGSEASFEQGKELLDIIGGKIEHFGPAGTGCIAKLTNQMIIASIRAANAEAFVLAVKNGLNPQQLYETLMGAFAANRCMEVDLPNLVEIQTNAPLSFWKA